MEESSYDINIVILCLAVGTFLITVISTVCYNVCHSILFPEYDEEYKNNLCRSNYRSTENDGNIFNDFV